MILCFRTNNIINNKYFEREPDHLQVLVSVKQWDLHLSDQIVYPLGVGPEWSAVQIKSRRRAERAGHDISNILLLLLMCRDHSPLRCRSNVYMCCCRCLLRCVDCPPLLSLTSDDAAAKLWAAAASACLESLYICIGAVVRNTRAVRKLNRALGHPNPISRHCLSFASVFFSRRKKKLRRGLYFFFLWVQIQQEKR